MFMSRDARSAQEEKTCIDRNRAMEKIMLKSQFYRDWNLTSTTPTLPAVFFLGGGGRLVHSFRHTSQKKGVFPLITEEQRPMDTK